MKKLLVILAVVIFGLGAVASDLIIDSKTQSYSEKDNKIHFDGDVKVTIDDMKVYGDKADVTVGKKNKLELATFYDKPYAVQTKKNKKREVKANILKLSLIHKVLIAEGDAQVIVSDGKYPTVIITADEQEYDTKSNIMKANGGVIIKYKELETFSDRAIIVTDKGGDLKKIDLIGNARLKEGKSDSSADHFIYNPVTQELIAMGNVTSTAYLDDGSKLTMKSHYQQFDKVSNTFNGSGNVRIWFKDYFAQGPKVTFYPDKVTNKPNEIFFTGRSSITQDVKTIFADKIKMVLKPKNFYAEGNAKTIIRDIGAFSENEKF